MSWQSEEAFREAAGKAAGGLPKKHVHVDTAAAIPAALRTAGLLYQAEASEKAAAKPALTCPSCGEVATDIAGAKQLYQMDHQEAVGKSYKGDLPPCPVSGLSRPDMLYTVEPCGCRVSQEWAGAFTAEMQSRLSDNPPKAISDMTAKQRAAKVAHYQDRLSALYSLQAVDNPPETKEAIDYWIVVCADQIQRLSPGAHNKKPMAKPLESKVQGWANTNGFHTPPLPFAEPPPVGDGTPLYRMSNGTVCTLPQYEGQLPCGIAQGPPDGHGKVPAFPVKSKVDFKKQASAQDVLDAAVLAAQAGLIDPGSLHAKLIGQVLGTPKPDLPTIEQTRTKQYAVRHGDIYKVFVTLDEAQTYAAQLANVTPGFAKTMKPKPQLQTLPAESPPVDIFGGTKEEKAPHLEKEKEAFKEQLKKVLKATHAEELPTELLSRIIGYTYTHQAVCQQVAEQAFGMHGSLISQVEILLKIRTDMQEYVAGRRQTLAVTTTKFVKLFVDLVEFDAIEPAKVDRPAAAAIPVPPPPVERHVKKKRTIRKIED